MEQASWEWMSLIDTLETHLGLALKAQGITAGGLLGLKREYKLTGVQRALWGQRSVRRWVAWHRFSGVVGKLGTLKAEGSCWSAELGASLEG